MVNPGLTGDEKDCINHLVAAWNAFRDISRSSPGIVSLDDEADFLVAIHDAQKVIALRVARRANPEVWV